MKKILLLSLAVITFNIIHAQTPGALDSLNQYTGKYKFPEGTAIAEVTVTLDNGTLYGITTEGSSELRRREGDTFDIVAFAGTATFKRNDGKVTRLRIQVEDLDAEGEKVDGAPSPAWSWQHKR